MKKSFTLRALVGAACVSPLLAHGFGGHYVVDDAALVDPGSCEVETWYSRADSDTDEVSGRLTCNVVPNLDLAVAVSRFSPDSETAVELEAKTLFREMDASGWAWGLTVIGHFSDSMSEFDGVEAYIPVTKALTDNLDVHTNVGFAYEHDGDDVAIWGLGAEYALGGGVSLIGETYGSHEGGTELQVGARAELGAGHLDLSYGQVRRDSDDNWVTVGFAWAF